ncbi:MAG TPA: TIM barrel protein [Candidatus Nanoarchaeia archaeon]|nr:TIM barrel protein [Candidatus Nanoarchaeia archaeon]
MPRKRGTMVQFGSFNSGYQTPMDRDYGHHGTLHEGIHSPKNLSTNDVGVGMGDFGMSMGLGPVPNVQAVQAKVRPGSKTVEFVFTGAGKGSGQGQTPEMYGLKQRQALSEMGRANRVDFTTHATVGVYGLAGMDQQGNFSKQSRNMALQEIKRAVEFAKDVAAGGPVVVHTGEFQRPIYDAEWNGRDEEWKGKFKMYSDEPERASYRVVDTRTGGLIQEARKNRKVARQVWNRYDHDSEQWSEHGGNSYTDSKGNMVQPGDYVDYYGNKLDMELRVPKYDKEQGRFMAEHLDWNDLKKEAEEMTTRAREVWRSWKNGELSDEKFRKSNWVKFQDVDREEDIKVRPEEAYIITTLETNAANSRGWAYYYGADFAGSVEELKKLEDAYEFYKKLESTVDPEEKWKLQREMPGFAGLVPPDVKYPSQLLKERLNLMKGKMKQGQEASASQWAQAEESMETIRHVESAETYARKEAADSYALAAIKAMELSKNLQKKGELKKPLTIAMENLFPESYGAHPDELIELVTISRKKMEKMLVQRGMSDEEAQENSKKHITSTLDTGHLNMWRKYWIGDQNKTLEQNDQEFNNWMLKKIGNMMDAGIIGHVHIDDNYGYHDDHLAPGEGNTPIKEMVKLLKEKGYKGELIVEPGADYTTDVSGFHSVMKTWRLFGSPVYGAGAGGSIPGGRQWGQVQYGWFGQNAPPYFTFGTYSPSEDWTLWSGVQME